MNQDPRNIFVNNRTNYAEQTPNNGATTTAGQNASPNSTFADEQGASCAGQSTNQQGNVDQRIAQMQALAQKYQREGEGQLIRDIVSNVIAEKAKGNLSNQQLITFANRVMPLLNTDQKSRLQGLLDELLKL